MQLFIIVVITLLLRFSESKTSPLNHLRGSPFHDDTHEHHEDEPHERALQKKCGGDIKTTLFKGNITMQSLLRPLQCTAEALVNIGIVLDLVFDEVVNENKALSPVNLNTTVCTTPTITTTKGNYFNRRLGAQSSAKYTYRAGKCTILFCFLLYYCISTLLFEIGGGCRLCNPDNSDRRARHLQLDQLSSSLSSVTHSSSRALLLSSLISGITSNAFALAPNAIQTTFNATSTFLDYVPLLEYQLKLYLTKEITTRFGTKPGHCLFGSLLDFDVKLMEATSWQDNQC